MRAKGTPATMGELMGGQKESKMSLKDLDVILGEKRQDMPRNKVGRYRLMQSLRNRYGNGYRNIPGVKDLMKEFDEEIRYEGVIAKIKKIKPQRSK